MRKAAYETSRKKEVGVSDLTLLSKISNESINDNLRKRFEHQEIYVPPFQWDKTDSDIHWACIDKRQSFPGFGNLYRCRPRLLPRTQSIGGHYSAATIGLL